MACTCEMDRIERMKEIVNQKHDVGKMISIQCGEHMLNMNFQSIKGEYLIAEFKKTKSNGSLYKGISKERLFTQYSYCPYCGTKYDLNSEED